MATKITKKRERRLTDSKVVLEKRQNMSKTPDKKHLGGDDESVHTCENIGNPLLLGGAVSDECEVTKHPEPSLGSILAAINSLHVKFDQHTAELRGVQKTVTELEERLNVMEDDVDSCTGGISSLSNQHLLHEQDLRLLKDIVIKQQHEINLLKKHTVDLTARSMRENLLFHNLPESGDMSENCEQSVCDGLRKLGIQLKSDLCCDRIHRLGAYKPGMKFPRPIVAKLHPKQCEEILSQVKKQPNLANIRITRQFPHEYRERRKQMWEVAESHRALDPACKSKITADGTLYLNGQLYKETCQMPNAETLLRLDRREKEEVQTTAPTLYEGKVIFDAGSSFQAAAARVKSIQEARKAGTVFRLEPGRLAAAHNISVLRLFSTTTSKTQEWWDDDGEYGAGNRIRNLLHRKNLTNIIVFLSRGTEGIHLGAKRHIHMEEAVKSALENLLNSEK